MLDLSNLFDLEVHLAADEPHILLRREGEPGVVRVYLGDVRYLISALGSMAAERTGGWWAILARLADGYAPAAHPFALTCGAPPLTLGTRT